MKYNKNVYGDFPAAEVLSEILYVKKDKRIQNRVSNIIVEATTDINQLEKLEKATRRRMVSILRKYYLELADNIPDTKIRTYTKNVLVKYFKQFICSEKY